MGETTREKPERRESEKKMGGGSVKELKSKAELEKTLAEKTTVILHFWASWCEASKQMDQVFSHLSTDFPHACFFRVEPEEQLEISEAYSVAAVPYFVFFKHGKPSSLFELQFPFKHKRRSFQSMFSVSLLVQFSC